MHNGKVKICDFGFAKSMEDMKQSENTILGTFSFMAPEILEGKGEYSHNIDVFSAGVVLFQMIFGVDQYPYILNKTVSCKEIEKMPNN